MYVHGQPQATFLSDIKIHTDFLNTVHNSVHKVNHCENPMYLKITVALTSLF